MTERIFGLLILYVLGLTIPWPISLPRKARPFSTCVEPVDNCDKPPKRIVQFFNSVQKVVDSSLPFAELRKAVIVIVLFCPQTLLIIGQKSLLRYF